MHNLVKLSIKELKKCNECKKEGMYIDLEKKTNEQCVCCTICDKNVDLKTPDNDFVLKYRNKDGKTITMYYCVYCRILFSEGCYHLDNKHINTKLYNTHFISKYCYDGDKGYGMPLFMNTEDFYNNINKISILQLTCSNNGSYCIYNLDNTKKGCSLNTLDEDDEYFLVEN